MLLQNKNVLIYGAGGSLGGAIARAMAKAGSNLFLSGHNLEPVQQL
jgi:3-oxoacyl-[acyl-carrier protein] reductase